MELNSSLFIIKPGQSKKHMEFDKWQFICNWFCYHNNFMPPKISISETISGPARFFIKSEEIKINLERCALIKDKKYGNYTGSVNDCSVGGAMCHELGHLIHERFEPRTRATCDEYLDDIRTKEKAVNPYASSNRYEDMAEMMRLFIINPDLLKLGRPLRYSLLTETLTFKPIHFTQYKDVLKNAGEEVIEKCNNWIKQII